MLEQLGNINCEMHENPTLDIHWRANEQQLCAGRWLRTETFRWGQPTVRDACWRRLVDRCASAMYGKQETMKRVWRRNWGGGGWCRRCHANIRHLQYCPFEAVPSIAVYIRAAYWFCLQDIAGAVRSVEHQFLHFSFYITELYWMLLSASNIMSTW